VSAVWSYLDRSSELKQFDRPSQYSLPCCSLAEKDPALDAAAMASLELWRVPAGRPEGEWARLAAAALSDPPAAAESGGGARAAPEGMGDIEDCPWHVSAPAHWAMYEYRLANADPEL
jgi:hypothetical protein